METGTYITTNIILSDVLKRVDDERMEVNSEGYYISLVQQAIEQLAIDTFFDKRHEDFSFPVNTLTIPMPKGAFNIRGIWLFNGAECNIGKSQNVYWKRNYMTAGGGYIAKAKEGSKDPFYSTAYRRSDSWTDNTANPSSPHMGSFETAYFCNIQNGHLMFSSSCRGYQNVRVVFNGTHCDIGDVPTIPIAFRQAIAAWVTVAALEVRMAKDPAKWKAVLQYWDQKLNGKNDFDGLWYQAELLTKTMHTAFKENLGEYLSKLNA